MLSKLFIILDLPNKQCFMNCIYFLLCKAGAHLSRMLILFHVADATPEYVKKSRGKDFNDVLTNLRAHLGSKGTLSRYNHLHTKVWAEGIIDGTYTSIHDEPLWENLLDQVYTLPRRGHREIPAAPGAAPVATTTPAAMSEGLMTMMMWAQERRDEEERRREERREEREREEERRREERMEREERRMRQEAEERREEQRRRDEQFMMFMKVMMDKKN